MLDRDVLIVESVGLLLGGVQHAGERLRDVHLARGGAGTTDARTPRQVLVEFVAERLDVDVESRE